MVLGAAAGAAGGPALIRLLVLFLLAFLPAAASAQTPARERQLVYALNVFDGTTYDTTFVPASIGTMYLMAGADSVVDPKLTEVYYWAITNEYRPDFEALNQLVPGTLVVSQVGRQVASVGLAPYVVQFDQSGRDPNGHVYVGDAAQVAWSRFQQERSAYVERLHEFAEATAASASNPPEQPAPFQLYSTEPAQGFPLNLPAGAYDVQLRDASGAVVPGSQKRLVAVAPRRVGVGYEVVPQEKWTYPENADDPADAIHTVPGGVVHLRPFRQIEFNALEYARLKNPQDLQATANRWIWVHTSQIAGATLRVREGGTEQRLPLTEFKVEQLPGGALGYRVVPFDRAKGGSPDLVSYRVEAPPTRAGLTAALVDGDGREIPGSARRINAIPPVADWQLGLPVVVPLALGLTVALWRRDQVKTVRALTPEQRQMVA